MSSPERVVLIGMGSTAESALAALLDRFRVVGLVRDAGPEDGAIRAAEESGAEIVTDVSISAVRRIIARTGPDCVVVSSYNRILPADLVNERPFVNVHYAPLPRYRGRATVNWAIINGERHAAITIHELIAGLDSGGILFQESVPIGDRDTVTLIYERLNELQRNALADAVTRLLGGDRGIAQDEARASYACTRLPTDGDIDWTRSAREVDRLVRALTFPYPGAYTWLGTERVVVHRAEPVSDVIYEGAVPGRVVRVHRASGAVDVLTGDGLIRLLDVSTDGRPVRPAEILSSVSCTLGFAAPGLLAVLMQQLADKYLATRQ